MAKKEILIKEEHTLEDLTSIAKTIKPITKQILGSKGLMEMEILSGWTGIVGNELSQFTLPQRISFKKTKNIFLCILGDERRALFTKNNARPKIECVNLYLTYP